MTTDTPNYYKNINADQKENESAALIYAARNISVVDWMNRVDAPTMWDYALRLCADYRITNPQARLINKIVRLANMDY